MNNFNKVAAIINFINGFFGFLLYIWMYFAIRKNSKKEWSAFNYLFVWGAFVNIPLYVFNIIAHRVPDWTETDDYFDNFYYSNFIYYPDRDGQNFFKFLFVMQIIFASIQQFYIAIFLFDCVVWTCETKLNNYVYKFVLTVVLMVSVGLSIGGTFRYWSYGYKTSRNMSWNHYHIYVIWYHDDVQVEQILFRSTMMIIHGFLILCILFNILRRNFGDKVYKPLLYTVLTPTVWAILAIIQMFMANYCSKVSFIPTGYRTEFHYWMFLHTPVFTDYFTLFPAYFYICAHKPMQKQCSDLLRSYESRRQPRTNNERGNDVEMAVMVPQGSEE